MKQLKFLPDTLDPTIQRVVEDLKTGLDCEAMHLKFVSVYWLYLSAFYFVELPLEVFETLNLQGQRDERGRLKDLIVLSLKAEWKQAYNEYKERWNKILERRQQREKKVRDEGELKKRDREEEKQDAEKEQVVDEIEKQLKDEEVVREQVGEPESPEQKLEEGEAVIKRQRID